MKYPNITSALLAVTHYKDIPVPEAPELYEMESYDGEKNETSEHEPSMMKIIA